MNRAPHDDAGSRPDRVEDSPALAEFAALSDDDPRREALRGELTAHYLPVARNIARRFSRRGEPTEDLEQVASLGLLNALDRFDPAHGRGFLSFAIPTITGEVRRYFRDAAWSVRTPRSVKDRYVAVGTATTTLAQVLGRAPTISELAEHLETSRDEVAEALAAHGSFRPTSLDQPVGEEDAALVDVLGGLDAELDRVETRQLVRGLVARLPDRERRMLVMRFVHERTQAEIASVLCISQMHVSRLLTRTLGELRTQLDTEAAEPAPSPPVLAS